MTVESYPSGLIPKCGWNACIGTIDLIRVVPECVVARRLDGPKEKYIDDSLGDEYRFLKSDTFRDSGLVDMSVSLLGALLTVKDMCLRQTGVASDDWDGNEVDVASLVEKYVLEPTEEWFCISWPVITIHAQEIPYKKSADKGAYKALKENVKKVTGVVLGEFDDYLSQKQPLTAKTVLSHKPTMLNYWHFTFNVRPADSEAFIKKIGKEWSDALFAQISKDLFRYSFSYAAPDGAFPEIPPTLWEGGK